MLDRFFERRGPVAANGAYRSEEADWGARARSLEDARRCEEADRGEGAVAGRHLSLRGGRSPKAPDRARTPRASRAPSQSRAGGEALGVSPLETGRRSRRKPSETSRPRRQSGCRRPLMPESRRLRVSGGGEGELTPAGVSTECPSSPNEGSSSGKVAGRPGPRNARSAGAVECTQPETSPHRWASPKPRSPMRTSPTPSAREVRHPAATRLHRAIDSAIEVLDRLEPSDRIRGLAERARELKEQIVMWEYVPPSTEVREAVMRSALSLHLDALALLRAASNTEGLFAGGASRGELGSP